MYQRTWVVKFVAFFALLHTTFTQPLAASSSDPSSVKLTYVFSVQVQLGPPPTQIGDNPITIPGGVAVPEPILGGTFSGPLLNATISSGLAVPQIYQNGTQQEPIIDLYGVTEDGHPFSIHETGVGSPNAQMTRIVRL